MRAREACVVNEIRTGCRQAVVIIDDIFGKDDVQDDSVHSRRRRGSLLGHRLNNKTTRNEIDDVLLRGLVRAAFEVEHVHWSDVMAKRLKRGDTPIVATGITPSGEFHIGHLREILTGDMIARAARRAGMNAERAVVDNADPLRKVYPFLDDAYEAFIGHQPGSIPAPDAAGKPDWDRYNNEG